MEQNIAYDKYPQTVLDVYVPSGAGPGKRVCGVLNFHGGGWTSGSKEAVVGPNVIPWLEKGCVVANVEYRLATVAPAPAAVQDALQAAAWFRRNASKYGVDSKHIVASGRSAGAHLALMTAMTPKSAKFGPVKKVAAVVNFFGITDVEDEMGGVNEQPYAITWVPQMEGRMELARRVSPLTWVRKKLPPVLTLHGTADATVPYEQGVRLTKALRDGGSDAEMLSISNAGHGEPWEKFSANWPQIFEFLRRRGFFRER